MATTAAGAAEIGSVLSSCLYGVSLIQSYEYYKSQTQPGSAVKDSLWLRLVVALVVPRVFDAFHTIAMWIYLYGLTILHPSDTSVVFFTSRVYALSRRRILVPLLGWVATAAKLARSLALIIISATSEDYTGIFGERIAITGTFITVAVLEVYNTAALCIILWSMRPKTFSNTRRTIAKLIVWSLQTGIIISTFHRTSEIIFTLSVDYSQLPRTHPTSHDQ
ncbi:hypothetical protein OE88DRAFT_737376 [Heliocybe sulcata]|uniref:Uncharacterized protein n=1 Tax=Heliocybe sulcata TaxID=5364 RepID=A0A5C3MRS3_9AGAM|nr:hypothetical protein OE88DRAFT_737376 [Heliocybe sulcata]